MYLIVSGAQVEWSVSVGVLRVDVSPVVQEMFQVLDTTI